MKFVLRTVLRFLILTIVLWNLWLFFVRNLTIVLCNPALESKANSQKRINYLSLCIWKHFLWKYEVLIQLRSTDSHESNAYRKIQQSSNKKSIYIMYNKCMQNYISWWIFFFILLLGGGSSWQKTTQDKILSSYFRCACVGNSA